MTNSLTDQEVRKTLPPLRGQHVLWDGLYKGLGLRITPSVAKAFILDYRIDGRQRRMTIGNYPDWSVAAAKEEFRKLKKKIDQGIDPLDLREEKHDAATLPELRTINGSKLTPEQRKLVKAHLGGETLETKRTGAAGRPNSSDIVIAEFERRKAAGTTEKTLTEEAEWLEAWFARQHLDRVRVKAKTIMNKIRDSFRKNKESKKNTQK